MNYQSPELSNLETIKQPLGPHRPDPISFEYIKSDLKLLISLKNKTYQKYFDQANLTVINDENGAVFLNKMMSIIESVMVDNLTIDDPKRWQISNYFNIIKSSFKGLDKLTNTTNKDAVCASLIGILTKNYL